MFRNILYPASLFFLLTLLAGCVREVALPVTAGFDFQSPNNSFTIPATVTFTNTSAGGETFQWTFEGGEPSTSTKKTPGEIIYKTPGTYNVRLEVSNFDGNRNVIEKKITIDAHLKADFSYALEGNTYAPAVVKLLLTKTGSLKKFVFCILSGAPGMFFTAFYVTLAPEFAKSFGLGNVTTPQVLLYYMLAYSAFDVVGNVISKLMKSRKLTILLFCGIQAFAIVNLFVFKPTTVNGFIFKYIVLGASLGYIGVVVTNIAEQFGTNLRATATTSATNLLRALTIPGTWLFTFLHPSMGIEKAGMTVGLVFIFLSVVSILQLKDN